MKRLLSLFFLLMSAHVFAQITVDTTGGNVIVKESTPTAKKSISIYRTPSEHDGWQHHIVYEPNFAVYGDDPDTLFLNFSVEELHIKAMLDEALKWKKFNFYRFAFNVAPYHDLVSKLADIYAASPEWNAYLKKSGSLQVTDTLWDGNQINEIRYDVVLARSVLDKSDFLQQLNNFFLHYGYKLTANGFPDDRQPIVSKNELKALGKPETLLVPIPNGYFNMVKIGKSK